MKIIHGPNLFSYLIWGVRSEPVLYRDARYPVPRLCNQVVDDFPGRTIVRMEFRRIIYWAQDKRTEFIASGDMLRKSCSNGDVHRGGVSDRAERKLKSRFCLATTALSV